MKKYLPVALVVIIALSACTKTVSVPVPTPGPGPQLTYKSRYILTIGGPIKKAKTIGTFSTPQTNFINFLDPNITSLESYATWHDVSESGQPILRGAAVQATADIAARVMHGFNKCTLFQYQNKEVSHYSDGTSKDVPVGPQYYVIVKAE